MTKIKVDTAIEVFANAFPLIDDTDFKTRETGVTYDAAGMDLVWNFQTPDGAVSQTAVTPTTAGTYDWTHVGDGMYKIEIPASGGASINNDTEGVGWFTGIATGVLPWASPRYEMVPANISDSLVKGTDLLQVDMTQIGGDAQSATDLKDFADAGYDPATNKVQGVVLTDTLTTYTGNTVQTGDAYARLGAPAGASVSADVAARTLAAADYATATNLAEVAGYLDTEIAAIKAKTDNLPAAPAATGDIPTATQNADALLKRDMSAVTGEAARSPLNALRAIRNKTSIAAGTLTVTKEDDSTAAWTAAVSTDASADPIIGVDPA